MEYELGANAIFDTLKCAACGNKDFVEKQKTREGNTKYVYVCQNCSHLMAFEHILKNK